MLWGMGRCLQEETAPELDVERGFYQQDICNASPSLPVYSLKAQEVR